MPLHTPLAAAERTAYDDTMEQKPPQWALSGCCVDLVSPHSTRNCRPGGGPTADEGDKNASHRAITVANKMRSKDGTGKSPAWMRRANQALAPVLMEFLKR
jgi:hypothetical protein